MAYNLNTHKSGDTFSGATFTVNVNAAPLDLTGATIVLTMRQTDCLGPIALTLDTTSGLTVTDAPNGIFQIDEQIISVTPATYYYDIQFTLADASKKTYISGTWIITSGLEC
jgi:hypothetical protein